LLRVSEEYYVGHRSSKFNFIPVKRT